MKVAFANEADFFNEVMLELAQIEQNIVRVEHRLKYQPGGLTKHLLVATAIAAGRLIELRRSFGVSLNDDKSDRVVDAAEKARLWLTDELLKQRFEVRNGIFMEN